MSSLIATTLCLAAAVAFTVFCGWRGAQPPDLFKGPRMAPWRMLMLLGVVASLLLVVHLANLAGLETGAGGGRGFF